MKQRDGDRKREKARLTQRQLVVFSANAQEIVRGMNIVLYMIYRTNLKGKELLPYFVLIINSRVYT